ncbi:alpha/beta hydrolase [Desulfopila sp. IMCC35006]|uniref:alpha/beta hydrolase n=1 Tax=Desulfopila sp. IMCC35006 TaxID=2569542 RepID=UPI00142E9D36|nr:alpha/beta fold hydrolase [Desulfopila sp. IMCC35006]
MTLGIQFFVLLLIVYLFCMLFMYLRQESFLFFPPAARHENHGYTDVVDYQLRQKAVTLRGWLVNPGLVREKLLIYYGGNGEDIFNNIDEFVDVKAASLFVAYRGYGPSDGKPGEAELFADALAVIDDVRHSYAPRQMYLIGRSLGSGVACYVAAQRNVQGAVLVTPYDSIVNIARSSYPWLPVSLLLRHRFDSLQFLAQIGCPLLVIYGGQDRVVPPERTNNLIEHIVGKKEIVFIDRADHGTIDMFADYWPAVLRFINPPETGSKEVKKSTNRLNSLDDGEL